MESHEAGGVTFSLGVAEVRGPGKRCMRLSASSKLCACTSRHHVITRPEPDRGNAYV